MEWISVKDRLPEISYFESDDVEHPYESFEVMVFCPQEPGIFCVAYLVMNQNENDWNYKELSWESYIPSRGGHIEDVDFETFTHWMPLPQPPT